MLLPSALSCDSSHRNAPAPSTRYHSAAALFSSPPTSPPPNVSTTLFATCRALQSMLSSPSPSQLPTPPMAHAAPPSPFKLRLRSRKTTTDGEEDPSTQRMSRRKITKRNAPPPRGINKRRRAIDDDASRDMADSDDEGESQRLPPDETAGPSTPKRIRLAPEVMPMGLERSDFDRLARGDSTAAAITDAALEATQDTTTDAECNGPSSHHPQEEEWSSAEDRLLVELVLEKLKLSKSDWQDCARSLGKDRSSVGRRWKSLMGHGEVGLKRGVGGGGHLRRGKIHATWRA